MNGTRDPLLVRHLVARAGAYTEVWLDAQIQNWRRYRPEAWAIEPSVGSPVWRSDVRWIAEHSPPMQLWKRLSDVAQRYAVARWVRACLLRAAPRVSANPPHVLHAHFGPVAWEWLPIIERIERPLVVSFYGYDAAQTRFTREPWQHRYEQLFARVDRYIVEGPAMERRLAALGAPADRIHIVRLPFSHTDLPSRELSERVDHDVIMAGRFVDKKGFDDGLRACTRALGADASIVLVGEGPNEEKLRHLVDALGLTNVAFRPPVHLTDLAELIARSRVALFPSRTAPDGDGEGGAPLTLTLAQYVGTRVVVTDHDDLPFAAAPGTPVVDEGDVDGLAAVLTTVHHQAVRGDEEHRTARIAARRFVTIEHDVDALTEERERIYDLTLDAREL